MFRKYPGGAQNPRDAAPWLDGGSEVNCDLLSPLTPGPGPFQRFRCTLQHGHGGAHLGGGAVPGNVYAEWDDDRATDAVEAIA